MEGREVSLVSSIFDSVLGACDLRTLLAHTTEQLGHALEATRCVTILHPSAEIFDQPPVEWCRVESDPSLDKYSLELAEYIQQLLEPLPSTLVGPPSTFSSFQCLHPNCVIFRSDSNQRLSCGTDYSGRFFSRLGGGNIESSDGKNQCCL